jgi:hypothetical protein
MNHRCENLKSDIISSLFPSVHFVQNPDENAVILVQVLWSRYIIPSCVYELGVRQVLTNAWQLQDAAFRHFRFADTSLQIHRQWQRNQLHTFPSVAATATATATAADVVVRISRGTVRLISPRTRIHWGSHAPSRLNWRAISETDLISKTDVIISLGESRQYLTLHPGWHHNLCSSAFLY